VDLSFYEDASDRVAALRDSTKKLETFLTSFIDFPKPLMAGVNGPAIGITVTTLALADIVWCSQSATFSAPFAVTAQSPEGCSSHLFPLIFGRSLANEILMLNRKLDAREALDRGLVSRIIPDVTGEEFLGKVTADLAQAIANFSTESMAATKSLIMNAETKNHLKKVMREENAVLNKRMMTEEFTTFITKFMAKGKKKN
jgi:peroxisomal 3,2-trans-enoyl-CoA isomerase